MLWICASSWGMKYFIQGKTKPYNQWRTLTRIFPSSTWLLLLTLSTLIYHSSPRPHWNRRCCDKATKARAHQCTVDGCKNLTKLNSRSSCDALAWWWLKDGLFATMLVISICYSYTRTDTNDRCGVILHEANRLWNNLPSSTYPCCHRGWFEPQL